MARPPRSREGLFDCWELERAWGITETGVTRARDQVVRRWAMLLLLDPERATNELQAAMRDARGELRANTDRYDRDRQQAFEDELPDRVARQCGGRLIEC